MFYYFLKIELVDFIGLILFLIYLLHTLLRAL